MSQNRHVFEVTRYVKDGTPVVESTRSCSDRKSAERSAYEDQRLLQDICRKPVRVEEVPFEV